MPKYTIMPYTKIDGIPTIRDSQIADIYNKIFEDGIQDSFFYDGEVGSTAEWVHFIKSGKVILWQLFCDDVPMGFCYFSEYTQASANCHFLVYKEFWGSGDALPAGKNAMTEALKIFSTITGMCPTTNRFAVRYLQNVGLKIIYDVPNALWSEKEGKAINGTLLYITRKDSE